MKPINIYQPELGNEELNAIKQVFDSNWLGYGRQGTRQTEFVNLFANKIITETFEGMGYSLSNTENLITISCCTEALFQSVQSYISPGDEVIIPTIGFVAAANAVIAHGGTPIFCDVNQHTLNVELDHIKDKVTNKTKAIIVMHFAGVPCDIERITKFCSQHNIRVIEDNANSPFSRINMKNTGTFGDVGLWSFDPMKVITTGDGGMIYSEDKKILQDIKYRTYLGLKGSAKSNPVDNKWWEFDIESPGSKATMNDISAAIGIEQLKKSDSFLKRRQSIHELYTKELSKLDWITTPLDIPKGITSSYYMYHIQLTDESTRNELSKYLRSYDIYTTFRYYPLHWVKYYNSKIVLPNAEYAANHTLCIPIHQSLTDNDVDRILSAIKEFKQI